MTGGVFQDITSRVTRPVLGLVTGMRAALERQPPIDRADWFVLCHMKILGNLRRYSNAKNRKLRYIQAP
jgi:hypothetical protein